MKITLVVVSIWLLVPGCGSRQERIEAEPEAVKAAPAEVDPAPAEQLTASKEEEHEASARAQVVDFLADVRDEKYEQAYEASSFVLKKVYSMDQFLMIAGKLQMEEMPCITDDDVAAMEPTSGHVGIGPKDISVDGFLIRYGCTPGGEKDRFLIIYLDWNGSWTPPGGVASLYWK